MASVFVLCGETPGSYRGQSARYETESETHPRRRDLAAGERLRDSPRAAGAAESSVRPPHTADSARAVGVGIILSRKR